MNRQFRVASIGELLWDLLPSGPQLGGAPSNLACHAAALGAAASVISRVGDDDLGRGAIQILNSRGVDTSMIAVDSELPTGTVSVELDPRGHPRFSIHEGVAWDRLAAEPRALDLIRHADAVCFGSLAQRTPSAHAAMQDLLAVSSQSLIRLFDINLRAPFYDPSIIESSLKAATALKLNEQELPVVGEMFGLEGSPESIIEPLAARFDLELVILTLGAEGSRAWASGTWTAAAAEPVEVRDTVGAGDAFTAAVVMGRLLQWEMPFILRIATSLAAHVCTQPGATPHLPAELTAPFLNG
jgi:fructokinase